MRFGIRSCFLSAFLFASPVVLAACASDGVDSGGPGGSGGSAASGGSGTAGTSGTGGGAGPGGAPGAGGYTGVTLKEKYAALFTVGAAVEPWHVMNQNALLSQHFNRLTAENAMKWSIIHPAEAMWKTANADTITAFARDKGMKMTGHAMVWHQQLPVWVFEGLTPGDAASKTKLEQRLRDHIYKMVELFGDVVDNWDVVNEAISDAAKLGDATDVLYRPGTGENASRWFQYAGRDYIKWAFKHTKEALEARQAGSSAGKLYYNDYNEVDKYEDVVEMVKWLRSEGCQVDGVGMQGHWSLDWPPTTSADGRNIQKTIDAYVAANLKVKISELDITVYSDYPPPDFGLEPAPETELTPQLEQRQAARYKALFKLFRDNAQHITSVTTWGTSDDRSWLDNFPVNGRNDYPLLFDDSHQPKDAYTAAVDF